MELCNPGYPLHITLEMLVDTLFNVYGQPRLQTLITKGGWEVMNPNFCLVHLYGKALWCLLGPNQYMSLFMFPVFLVLVYLYISLS